MPETIQMLKDAGLRDKVKVIVGGAPVSAEWAAEVGADAYGANAARGVEKCKELLGS
jgi:5-methyltetrahydrofolate--homocysteine methyltransferase